MKCQNPRTFDPFCIIRVKLYLLVVEFSFTSEVELYDFARWIGFDSSLSVSLA